MPRTYVTWLKQGCWFSWGIAIRLSVDPIFTDPLFHVIAAQPLLEHFHGVKLLVDGANALHFDDVEVLLERHWT